MYDRRNEVEHCRVPVSKDKAREFQKLMASYPSLRLLYEPEYSDNYIRFSYGGDGVDVSAFDQELYKLGYYYAEPEKERRPWWKRLFSKNDG
jgi:hypothetical protein